jgi:hypothetical protein
MFVRDVQSKNSALRNRMKADSTEILSGIQPSEQRTPETKRQDYLVAASTYDLTWAGRGVTPGRRQTRELYN